MSRYTVCVYEMARESILVTIGNERSHFRYVVVVVSIPNMFNKVSFRAYIPNSSRTAFEINDVKCSQFDPYCSNYIWFVHDFPPFSCWSRIFACVLCNLQFRLASPFSTLSLSSDFIALQYANCMKLFASNNWICMCVCVCTEKNGFTSQIEWRKVIKKCCSATFTYLDNFVAYLETSANKERGISHWEHGIHHINLQQASSFGKSLLFQPNNQRHPHVVK